ncbi:hypothetical protein BDV19DRAFT_212175 [Aspergillus venezuelensis]
MRSLRVAARSPLLYVLLSSFVHRSSTPTMTFFGLVIVQWVSNSNRELTRSENPTTNYCKKLARRRKNADPKMQISNVLAPGRNSTIVSQGLLPHVRESTNSEV